MKRAIAALGVLSLIAGCQQGVTQVADYNSGGGLVCTKGFDTLVEEISATPAIVVAKYERGLDAYRDDRTESLYLVTLPDHPAHPAIFKRSVAATSEGIGFASGACGYGDLAAMRKEVAAYSAFDSLLKAEERCWLCNTEKLSPSIDRRMPPPLTSMIQTP